MVSRVKFDILMRSSTMIWSRNIMCHMCGTAPSCVWYIQHLVQDRDLVQHHDLGPQEEQSWQQQNIEDTKNNYDSFFDVVKNGWKNWKNVLKPNTQNLKHFYKSTCFFNVLKYDMFLIVFENTCCLMEEDDARFAPFFEQKTKGKHVVWVKVKRFPKWLNIDNMKAWLTVWTRRLPSTSLNNSISITFLFFGGKPGQLQHNI